MKSNKLRLTFYLLAFAGAALFTLLLIREGASQVASAVATAGWALIAIIGYHLFVPIFLDAVAWWSLVPKSERLPVGKLFWMRWIGESVSTLVPSAAVGGDIVRARLASLKGMPLATAAGSVLVDITLGVFTQAIFTILGLALLVEATGERRFIGPTLIGTFVGVLAVGGFYFVQRLGMFRFLGTIIAKLASSAEWQTLIQSGETWDNTIRSLYARRRGVFGCCFWTLASLILNSGEVWIALSALGLDATISNAIILQSVALTLRNIAFPVPGGIGVQESGYVIVGNLLGIPGNDAFALSLIARVRELGLGIPGIICWQLIEGRRLLRERTAAAAP